MKRLLLNITSLFLFTTIKSYSQNVLDGNFRKPEEPIWYPCQQTKVGRLIIWPILEDSVVHYERVNSQNKDNPFNMSADTAEGPNVSRRLMQTDSILTLAFSYNKNSLICYYSLRIFNKKNNWLELFHLDENGLIIEWTKRIQYKPGKKYLREIYRKPFTNRNKEIYQSHVDSILNAFK